MKFLAKFLTVVCLLFSSTAVTMTFVQGMGNPAIVQNANALATQTLRQFLPFMIGAPEPWEYVREAEVVDDATVGRQINRSNACGGFVHGQFGAGGTSPWPAQAGMVKYTEIEVPRAMQLFLRLRYSKHSPSSIPIDVYLNDEASPRASFTPLNQGGWNSFAWTPPITLGSVSAGTHLLIFKTEGQQFGVADLDMLQLISSPQLPLPPC
jgi:hypothetical protein